MNQFVVRHVIADTKVASSLSEILKEIQPERDEISAAMIESGLPEEYADFFAGVWEQNTAYSKTKVRG